MFPIQHRGACPGSYQDNILVAPHNQSDLAFKLGRLHRPSLNSTAATFGSLCQPATMADGENFEDDLFADL